jgi:hypothetical protein
LSILHIAVTGADKDTQRRAVEALQAAGVEVYRSWIEPGPGELAEAEHGVPDRRGMVGARVRLTLNSWARPGPTEGLFLGQGPNGVTIQAEDGGRFRYAHHEVADLVEVTRA